MTCSGDCLLGATLSARAKAVELCGQKIARLVKVRKDTNTQRTILAPPESGTAVAYRGIHLAERNKGINILRERHVVLKLGWQDVGVGSR